MKPRWVILDRYPDFEILKAADQVFLQPYETAIVFEKVGETFLLIDPAGRVISVKGDLTDAEYSATGYSGPCETLRNVKLSNGASISQGSFLWCLNVDEEALTAEIQIGKNLVEKIPLWDVVFLREYVKSEDK